MAGNSDEARTSVPDPSWFQALSQYERSSLRKAIWQLVNTGLPYIALWGHMIYLVFRGSAYWMTLACAVVAGALLVRLFILFHDCCHGSFFASRRANLIVGSIIGVFTFTPYKEWRYTHARHHATAGNLDRRGMGDVWTMTIDEYRTASRWRRMAYRIVRNPLIMFGLGPLWVFVIAQRFAHKEARKQERQSVLITNLALVTIIGIASVTIGLRTYLMIQLPIILIAGMLGLWLFYVQHQFEGVYWDRHVSWDPMRAALEGSSYYKLPRVLQWLTGNIGLHHIHHIRPGIPNYHLQQCYDAIPALQAVKPLTIRKSLTSLWLNLWDEQRHRLVSFRSLAHSRHL